MPRSKRRRTLCLATIAVLSFAGFGWGGRDDEAYEKAAMKSLVRMSDFMAGTKQLGVTIEVAFDIVQDWGQKLEFGETRVVTIRRPDRLKVDVIDRNGAVSGVVFDGRRIAAFHAADKVYATTPQPGSLDQAIDHFVAELGMRLPGAAILQGRLAKDVKQWARDARYVEASSIEGVACDHVALHGDWEDVQLWIARGDRPLLQRMVITYHRAEGKPQFSAQFRHWDLAPDVSDAIFAFTPPAGASEISFQPRRMLPGAMQSGSGGTP